MASWNKVLTPDKKVKEVRTDGQGRFDFGGAQPHQQLTYGLEPGESLEKAVAQVLGYPAGSEVLFLRKGEHHGWGRHTWNHPNTDEVIH